MTNNMAGKEPKLTSGGVQGGAAAEQGINDWSGEGVKVRGRRKEPRDEGGCGEESALHTLSFCAAHGPPLSPVENSEPSKVRTRDG